MYTKEESIIIFPDISLKLTSIKISLTTPLLKKVLEDCDVNKPDLRLEELSIMNLLVSILLSKGIMVLLGFSSNTSSILL